MGDEYSSGPFDAHQTKKAKEYLQNTQPTAARYQWADQVLSDNRKPWSGFSTLYSWYQREDQKRYARQRNEIDINEIRAAHRGHKDNRWYKAVQTHPEVFKEVLEYRQGDWQKMLEALDNPHKPQETAKTLTQCDDLNDPYRF